MRRLGFNGRSRSSSAWMASARNCSATSMTRATAIASAVSAAAQRIPFHDGDAPKSRLTTVTFPQLLSLVQERMPDEIRSPVTWQELEEAVSANPDIEVVAGGNGGDGPMRITRRLPPNSQPSASAATMSSSTSADAAAKSAVSEPTDPLERPHLSQLAAQLYHAHTELSALKQSRSSDAAGEPIALSDIARRCSWSSNDVANVLEYVLPRLQRGAFSLPAPLTSAKQHVIPPLRVEPYVLVRPRQRPRACHLMVDGDGLTRADVALLMEALQVQAARSTQVVVRSVSTGAHTLHDIVTPRGIPPYLLLEREALALSASGAPPVLKDVIYLCASDKFRLFADHVSRAVAFPDCCVLVCCPDQMTVVSEPSYDTE